MVFINNVEESVRNTYAHMHARIGTKLSKAGDYLLIIEVFIQKYFSL